MIAKLNILRSNSSVGKESKYQMLEIETEPGQTVAGALQYIYENIDPTLAFRFTCNCQKCGECAVLVNNKPCLACETAVESEMTIEPLPNLPIIKDLVIDRRFVLSKPLEILPSLKAWAVKNRLEETEPGKIENYVKLTKCIECLMCQSICPARRDAPEQFVGPLGLVWIGERSITDEDHWNQELHKALKQCLSCGECWTACPHGENVPGLLFAKWVGAACRYACPAGVDVPRYVRLIAQNKPAEAMAVIREKMPFPAVCGRVCFHPCEAKCRRGQLDEPVAIRMLKRYAFEHDTGIWKSRSKVAKSTGKKVAIVGSGPAGLTAAYYLAKLGHTVTVYEALSEAGGMMRFGIPDYRLPKDILQGEIHEIQKTGVEIVYNARIDSIARLTENGFKAVFLAIGAQKSLKIGIEGEDNTKVMDGIKFLRNVVLGKKMKLGFKVAVIGGGKVAIDVARTAIRLGVKEVTIIYRRTEVEMPANKEEIKYALEEGVKIFSLATPTKIINHNNVADLFCIRMQLGKIGSDGRRIPEPIKDSHFKLSFNNIITAIGQRPEIPIGFSLNTSRDKCIKVDPDTLATSQKGVFAGGDTVSGSASVIEAIAAGRKAAISIDKYLGGKGIIDETLCQDKEETGLIADFSVTPLKDHEKKARACIECMSASNRISNFSEVELGFGVEKAIEEARRCLKCDLELREIVPDQ